LASAPVRSQLGHEADMSGVRFPLLYVTEMIYDDDRLDGFLREFIIGR
jgi:hypothetical protein